MKVQQVFALLAVQAIGDVLSAPVAGKTSIPWIAKFKSELTLDGSALEKKEEVAEVWANW